MIFRDRKEAGHQLAAALGEYKNRDDVVILALPRGGVIVAYEVAKDLKAQLDIVVPRKIGAPGNPEFAIGAITESGEGIFDEAALEYLQVNEKYIRKTVAEEQKEAKRRLKVYRCGRKAVPLRGRTVILIDDGIATGSTMRAAIKSVLARAARSVIVAVPVMPADRVSAFEKEVDELVYLDAPYDFAAVGQFYEYFEQTTDEEVVKIMGNFC